MSRLQTDAECLARYKRIVTRILEGLTVKEAAWKEEVNLRIAYSAAKRFNLTNHLLTQEEYQHILGRRAKNGYKI